MLAGMESKLGERLVGLEAVVRQLSGLFLFLA